MTGGGEGTQKNTPGSSAWKSQKNPGGQSQTAIACREELRGAAFSIAGRSQASNPAALQRMVSQMGMVCIGPPQEVSFVLQPTERRCLAGGCPGWGRP